MTTIEARIDCPSCPCPVVINVPARLHPDPAIDRAAARLALTVHLKQHA